MRYVMRIARLRNHQNFERTLRFQEMPGSMLGWVSMNPTRPPPCLLLFFIMSMVCVCVWVWHCRTWLKKRASQALFKWEVSYWVCVFLSPLIDNLQKVIEVGSIQ